MRIRVSSVDGAPADALSSVVALANVGSHSRSSAISVAGSTEGKSFRKELSEKSESLRAHTTFEPDVVSEIEQKNPEVLVWLRSVSGAAFQLGLICLYVLGDASKALLMSVAMRQGGKPIGAVIIGMNSFTSVLIGLGLVVITGQMAGGPGAAQAIKNALNAQQIKNFCGVAILFTLSAIVNVMAYSYIDASVNKILSQLRLPITACLGTFIVGKKYSMNHWMALIILTACAYNFYEGDQHHNTLNKQRKACFYPLEVYQPLTSEENSTFLNCNDDKHGVPAPWKAKPTSSNSPALGVTLVLTGTLLNVVASLLSEKFMKASAKTPFFVQKLQMELTGLPVAIISAFMMPLLQIMMSGAYYAELPETLPLAGNTLAGKFRGPSEAAATADMYKQALKQLGAAGELQRKWWAVQGTVGLTYNLTTRNEGAVESTNGPLTDKWQVGGQGPFMDWTGLVIVALLVDISLAWMGGIIVKKFSSVVKIICKALGLIATVIGSELFLKDDGAGSLPLPMYTIALVIFCDTILFSTMKDDKKPDAHEAHGPTAAVAAPEAREAREIEMAVSPQSSLRA